MSRLKTGKISHARYLFLGMGVLVGFSALLYGGEVFAQAAPTETNDTLQAFASILAVIVKLFSFIIIYVLQFVGPLMGTEYITSDQIMEHILPMWRFIRNITNIMFVVILLALSFTNLLAIGGQSQWSIKEKLPKVIFAIIAINFSLLVIRVLVDVVHVGTIAMLSITDTAIEHKTKSDILTTLMNEQGELCENAGESCREFIEWFDTYLCEVERDGQGAVIGYSRGGAAVDPNDCYFSFELPTEDGTATETNVILAFAVYFTALQQLPGLATVADNPDWTAVVDKTLFSLILGAAYGAAILATFVVLLLRMVMLWIFMVFSPLIVGVHILGLSSEFNPIEKFTTYLLIPLKVAAAFSVSFVMIATMFTVEVHDTYLVMGPALDMFAGHGVTGLFWEIATIVIFWKAAFWALSGTEAQGVVDTIKGGAEKAGSFVAKSTVLDKQFIPIPNENGGDGRTSLRTLFSVPDQFLRNYEDRQAQERRRDLSALGIGAADTFSDAVAEFSRAVNRDGGTWSQPQFQQQLTDFLSQLGGVTNMNNRSPEVLRALEALRSTRVGSNSTNARHLDEIITSVRNETLTPTDLEAALRGMGITDRSQLNRALGQAPPAPAPTAATGVETVQIGSQNIQVDMPDMRDQLDAHLSGGGNLDTEADIQSFARTFFDDPAIHGRITGGSDADRTALATRIRSEVNAARTRAGAAALPADIDANVIAAALGGI